jgi:hypothetical protein
VIVGFIESFWSLLSLRARRCILAAPFSVPRLRRCGVARVLSDLPQAIMSGCEESGGEGVAAATEGCTFSDPGLEEWLARQAAARRAGRLSAKRDARLRAAGVAWREVEVAGSPAKVPLPRLSRRIWTVGFKPYSRNPI